MQSAQELARQIGKRSASVALGVPRSSLYRSGQPRAQTLPARPSPRALSPSEKETIRQELNSERFQDCAPREVYATLLDEERYLCSWRSMYRILAEHQEVRERRNQLRHPSYTKPELLATAPNQLWSWDTPALAAQVQVSPNYWDRRNGRITTCT